MIVFLIILTIFFSSRWWGRWILKKLYPIFLIRFFKFAELFFELTKIKREKLDFSIFQNGRIASYNTTVKNDKNDKITVFVRWNSDGPIVSKIIIVYDDHEEEYNLHEGAVFNFTANDFDARCIHVYAFDPIEAAPTIIASLHGDEKLSLENY